MKILIEKMNKEAEQEEIIYYFEFENIHDSNKKNDLEFVPIC